MNKVLATILVTAGVIGFSSISAAATNEQKATYKAATTVASTEYKIARAKCDPLSGNAKDVCVAEAKAARVKAKADATALYKNTDKARASAAKDIAAAEYDVAKAKCGEKTGNDKDVCIKEAKSAKVAVVSDVKSDKKVVDARADASKDKMDAEYKVAAEKCDALAGAAKDACVAKAKAKFGK